MLKKIMFVGASVAAGVVMLGGVASADTGLGSNYWGEDDDNGQVGLGNLHNIDVAHNVSGVVGFCDNNVNVLGVQVPVRDTGNGLNVPVLSPGQNGAVGHTPYNCAAGGIIDGGSAQGH